MGYSEWLFAPCLQRHPENPLAYNLVYKHPKRPEWGMAVVSEQVEDCVRFKFEDLEVRAFKANNLQALDVVALSEADTTELRSRLIGKKPATNARTRKKKVAAKARPSSPSVAADE